MGLARFGVHTKREERGKRENRGVGENQRDERGKRSLINGINGV